jgi:hypothetical protein
MNLQGEPFIEQISTQPQKIPISQLGLIYHKLAKISTLSITFIPDEIDKLRIIKTPLLTGGF